MIDENKTFKLFGYTSDTLKPHSHKKVLRICDICKKEHLVQYRAYTNLCRICGHKTKKCRLKHSESHKGSYHTKETKQKISNSLKGDKHPMFGKHRDEKTKQKISNSLKGNKHP